MIRVGMGYDVHRFKDGGDVILGGVKIDYEQGLEAHSDGDVAIHAIIDALLGAVGEGDIGDHFPPSDSKWKNCDSCEMLKTVSHLLIKKGASIINLDVTIICEKPTISKFKDQMKESLANVLNISQSRVNVKATTTEKLGFLGRQEGIAAEAIASVKISFVEG